MIHYKLTNKNTSADSIKSKPMSVVSNPLRKLLIIGIILLNFVLIPQSYATHIVGGDINYKHISGDDYEITLRLYKDADGAPFDNTMHFFVYKEYDSDPSVFEVFQNTESENIGTAGIDLGDFIDPCVIDPPNIEFQYKEYSVILTLPDADDLKSYHVAAQRCCRNGSLSNINNPDETGMVWHVEILKKAIEIKHSCPEFNLFPEYFICTNEDSVIDFQATSNAGSANNTITYQPFQPRAEGTKEPTCYIRYKINQSCNNEEYNDLMIPPYDPVSWNGVTTDAQFGSTSTFNVDSNTGLVTVNPSNIGLYLVGIQATEVDSNGDTISMITKQFEFQTTVCVKTLASFDVPKSVCEETDISFENFSLEAISYEFYPFGLDSDIMIPYDNADVDFFEYEYPEPGVYTPALIAIGESCDDEITQELTIHSANYFENLVDTILQDSFLICQEESIEMNPSMFPSDYPFEDNLEFEWTYNDETFNEINPTFVFSEDSEVYLTITDTSIDDCEFDFTFIINLLETDPVFNDTFICLGDSLELEATFNNTTIVDVVWTPDLNISSTDTPAVTVFPTENTVYTALISYNYNNDESCPLTTEIVYNVSVEDLENSISTDTEVNCDNLGATLSASPVGNDYSYLWSTGETTDEINVNPSVNTTYTLITTFEPAACVDTSEQIILVPDPDFYLSLDTVYYCFGDESDITVTANTNINNTINWTYGGQTFSGPSITISPMNGNLITATVLDSLDCVYSDTTIILETQDFAVSINGPDTLCFNEFSAFDLEVIIDPVINVDSIIWYQNDEVFNNSNSTIITVTSDLSTIYKVLVIDEFGCEKEAIYNFNFFDDIDLSIDGNGIFCINEGSTMLSATPSDLEEILWFDAENNDLGSGSSINIAPGTSDIITAIGTDFNGCRDTAYFELIVPDSFNVSITGGNVYCLGEDDSVLLTAEVNPSSTIIETWTWYKNSFADIVGDNSNTLDADPTENASYWVTGEDTFGCLDTSEVHLITVPDTFSVNIIGANYLCYPNTDSLTLSFETTPADINIESVIWVGSNNTNYTTSTIDVYPPVNNTTTYILTVFDEFGCSASDTIIVTIPPEIEFDITGPTLNCAFDGDSVTIEATDALGLDYTWHLNNINTDPFATGNSITVDPLESTWYYVLAEDDFGCTKADSFFLEVPIDPEIIATDAIHCLSDTTDISIDISIEPAGDYSITWEWDDGTTNTGSGPVISFDPSESTYVYIQIVDNTNGCPYFDSVYVDVPEEITVEIVGDTFLCFNELVSVELGANSDLATSYIWTSTVNGESYPDLNTITTNPTVTSSYYVTVFDDNNCFARDTHEIVVSDPIQLTIEGDSIYCINETDSLELTAISNQVLSNYQWSAVPPLPASTNTSDSTLTIIPTAAITVYTVVGTDAYGCYTETSHTVMIPEEPEISIQDSIYCVGNRFNLDLEAIVSPSDDYTYNWSDENGYLGSTNPFTIELEGSMNFFLELIDNTNNCPYYDTIYIEVPNTIDVEIQGEDFLCFDELVPIDLTAISALAEIYDWSSSVVGESYPNNSMISTNPVQTSTYEVIVFDQYGCFATDTHVIEVSDSISIKIEGDTVYCSNETDSLTLEAISNITLSSYQWSAMPPLPAGTNTTDSILSIIPTAAITVYTVVGTDANGCDTEASFTVVIPEEPEIVIQDSIVCVDNIFNLNLEAIVSPTGDYTYNWSDENGYLGSINPFTTELEGSMNFFLELIDNTNNCPYYDTIYIEMPNTIDVEIQGDDFLCFDELVSIDLTAVSTLAEIYEWSSTVVGASYPNDSMISTNPVETSTYEVIVFDQYGCFATDTHVIEVSDSISIEIEGDTVYCSNETDSLILEAISNITLSSYQWSAVPPLPAGTNTTDSILSIIPTAAITVYTVVGTDADGCDTEATHTVIIPDEPIIDLSHYIYCEEDSTFVNLESEIDYPGDYEVIWTDEAGNTVGTQDNISIGIESSGFYYLEIVTEYDCVFNDSIYVEIPEINITINSSSDIVCIPGESTVILNTTSNVNIINYDWYILPGNNIVGQGPTFTDELINQTTTYAVIGTSDNGCEATDTIVVIIPEILIDFDLEPDTLLCFNELDNINIQVTNAVPDLITYTWFDEEGLIIQGPGDEDNYEFIPTETTTITVEGEDSYGCTHLESITISVTDPFELFVPTDSVCENMYFIDLIDYNEAVDNTLPTSSEITWVLNGNTVNTGNDSSFAFELPVGQQVNNYSVSYTDLNGCKVSASGIIYNYTLDLEDIYLGICPGDTAIINIPSSIYELTVDWNADEVNQVIETTNDFIKILLDSPGHIVTFNPIFINEQGCEDTITVTLETSDFITYPIQDTIICFSESICFNSPYNQNNTAYTYNWTSSNTDYESNESNPCFGPLEETTFFYVEITDGTSNVANCTAYDTIKVEVYSDLDDLEIISLPNQNVFCEIPNSITLILEADSNMYGINWTEIFTTNNLPADITLLTQFDGQETITIYPSQNGTYTYQVEVFSDPNGDQCPYSTSITFDIYPLEIELEDIVFCFNPDSEVDICVENLDPLNTNIDVQWYYDDNMAPDSCLTVSPMETTQYTASVVNDYGCEDDITATVNVIDLYTDFELSANFTEIFYGADSVLELTATLLNVNQVNDYNWDYDNVELNFFNVEMLSANASQLTETTEFTLTLFSEDSLCVDSQSITINLLESVCDTPNIFIPTAFSPNGDGLNDVLFVEGNLIEYMDLYIVNRWGQTVFESNDPNIGWDGTFLQEALPPDVYGFSLTAYCEDDDVFILKGNINLLR